MITIATLLTIGGITLTVGKWLAILGVAGNVLSFNTELIKVAAQLHGQQQAGIHCRCAQPLNAKANIPSSGFPMVPASHGQPAIYHDWLPSGDGFRAATVPPFSTISNKDHHYGRKETSSHRRSVS